MTFFATRSGAMRILLTVAAVSAFCPSARALMSDDHSIIEGAKLCTRYLPRHEREYGIPEHLLAAIASTESGRYHHALGLNLPWPWTINVEGKGYFFDTKQEAVNAVQKLHARGVQSIDVGCMQVNLYHHPNAFANLDQAFDPAYNVAYAAQFLTRNFHDEGTWRKATADYHSKTPMYGDQYARLVFSVWGRIVNKVADARAGRPILNANASLTSTGLRLASARPAHHTAVYHPHLHEISIANETTNEHGVLVVRPDHSFETSSTRKADPDDNGFVTIARETTRPVPTQQQRDLAVAAAQGPAKGPQIVKIRSGSSSGQFQPDSHVVRVSDSGSSSAPATPARNMFVFDN